MFYLTSHYVLCIDCLSLPEQHDEIPGGTERGCYFTDHIWLQERSHRLHLDQHSASVFTIFWCHVIEVFQKKKVNLLQVSVETSIWSYRKHEPDPSVCRSPAAGWCVCQCLSCGCTVQSTQRQPAAGDTATEGDAERDHVQTSFCLCFPVRASGRTDRRGASVGYILRPNESAVMSEGKLELLK